MNNEPVHGPTDGENADREYDAVLDLLKTDANADLVRRLDFAVGVRLAAAEAAQPEPEFDEGGFVVLCLNRRGGVIAFGPYGEDEAHEVASFAESLVPTWFISLRGDGEDERHPAPRIGRYGMDERGLWIELPHRTDSHPTRGGGK